ncbi:MAG: MaoC family dehydratase [Roseococcus sp.]|jgi:acyl dehydratase
MDRLPSLSMTMDRAAILAWAALTDDHNPLHVDEAFAAGTPFGRPIAHGMLSLSLLWQALRQGLGVAAPITLEVRFLRPVPQGARVTAGGERRAEGGFAVWVRDEAGQEVIRGVAWPGEPGG